MNLAFLPDLSALAILIALLLLLRRRHTQAQTDVWLIGLGFTLVEALAHTFYAPTGAPKVALHIIVLDCYLVAGLVFNLLGRQPEPGDRAEHEGLTFEVLETDGRRITQMRLALRTPDPSSETPLEQEIENAEG